MLSLRKQSGDTLVEVLISLTVLAVVIGAAFGSASRSIHQGIEANNRTQALSYAQAQVELLKNAANSQDLATFNHNYDHDMTSAYCVNNDATESTTPADVTSHVCSSASTDPFGVGVYTDQPVSPSTNKVFVVTVKWQSSLSNVTNSLVVYYKPAVDGYFQETPP